MAPRKKKLTKEEKRKREAVRKRYERIKNNLQKREELREIEHQKYLKKKEKGTRKLVMNMTPREHREAKNKWKEHCTKYCNKKKVLANITNSYMRENTPDSDVSNVSPQMPTLEIAEIIPKNSNREKRLRYKIKKKKDEKIRVLVKKVLKYKKRISRLKKKANTKPEDTPNTKFTWNYMESGHGKGAPDGVGATCKRTADAVVAAGGNVENLEKFVEAIEERCPTISLSIIQDDAIKEMSAENEREVTKVKNCVGTLKVRQVAGKFYNPLGIKSHLIEIVMKHLSCFCDIDCCLHSNIGKIIYEDKPKLNVDDVFTDSESENEAGPSSAAVKAFNTGDYILVKLFSRNTEYRYVSVIDMIDEEDGEIRVTVLKFCDNKGQTFRFDQNDVAHVTMDQVIQKLPNPNIVLKGHRMFYKFDSPVNVFEKQ